MNMGEEANTFLVLIFYILIEKLACDLINSYLKIPCLLQN